MSYSPLVSLLFRKFLSVLVFLSTLLAGNAQEKSNGEQFLFAIVEVSEDEQSDYTYRIISAKVHDATLKRGTRSIEPILRSEKSVKITLHSESEVFDEIHLANPLEVDYEYVSEDDQLTRKRVKKNTRTLAIRRTLPPGANTFTIQSNSSARSSNSSTYKFR